MRQLRKDYQETGLSTGKFKEFPTDLGGPYYTSYVREGTEHEYQFEDFKDREVRSIVQDLKDTETQFKVRAFWPGVKTKGHIFALNNDWVIKLFKLDPTISE